MKMWMQFTQCFNFLFFTPASQYNLQVFGQLTHKMNSFKYHHRIIEVTNPHNIVEHNWNNISETSLHCHELPMYLPIARQSATPGNSVLNNYTTF